MKQLLIEDHTADYVFISIVLRSGSLVDPGGAEGMAYLAANTLLLGTREMPRAVFLDELDYLGASLDVSVGKESVILEGEVISRNLDPFIKLLGDVIKFPALSVDEIEKLKRRTVAELEQIRDNDEALCAVFHGRHMWGNHPYGRPGKGTSATIGAIEHGSIASFLTAHVRDSNLIVAAAGHIEPAQLNDLVTRYLAGIPGEATTIPVLSTPTPAKGVRVFLVDKPERTQTQIMWGHPCIHAGHADYFPLMTANTAFGGTFTARLMREIREKRGWSYGATSRVGVDRQTGSFTMGYAPATKDAVAAIRLGHQLLETFVFEGPSAEELEFSKSYLTNAFPFRIETAAKRLGQMLETELLARPSNFVETYVQNVEAVTLEKAAEAVSRHIQPANITLTVVCTASDIEPELRSWDKVCELHVVPYDQM
ncbi:MAG: insulinase family protein [Myxococcales bacterium]|nr:insulinase family protein [Myxococcales bacterium]